MSEWKEVRLGDICSIFGRIGFRGYTTEDLVKTPNEGAISLSPSNIVHGDLNFEKLTYINWNKYEESPEIQIKKNDILLVKTGSSIGRTTIVNEVYHPMTLNPQMVVLKDIKINPLYLSYLMKGYNFQGLIRGIAGGSAIPTLSQKHLSALKITICDIKTQNEIAKIISPLDSKIAVNRRICENLEAQAQALFKHWFIDFAPFKNGNFVESELGMIPEGWRVGTLSEIADINPSRTIKKGTISTYLDMKNMPTSGSFPINWEDKEFVGGMKFKNGDTLMARITPCLENGKVAYVNFLKDGEIAFGSTEYIVMTAKESIFPEFLYTLCRFPSFVNYAVKNMNGSSGRQRVSGETISNYRMVIAPKSVYSSVRPLFQEYMLRIRECGFENLRLSTLRDTLLPKLMSGQIKV